MFYNLLKRKNCFVLEFLFKKKWIYNDCFVLFRMGWNYIDKCMYEYVKKKLIVFNIGMFFWCNWYEVLFLYLIIKKMFDVISK